jgi:release factor glutamine methyltransferase
LRFYERIAEEACRWLQPGGLLGLEIGAEQGRAVAELLQRSGYEAIEVHPDLNGLDRVVWCRRSRTE